MTDNFVFHKVTEFSHRELYKRKKTKEEGELCNVAGETVTEGKAGRE